MIWITEAEDAEVARIMRLSHAELVAEAHARGEDPKKIVAEVDDIIQSAKAEAGRLSKERTSKYYEGKETAFFVDPRPLCLMCGKPIMPGCPNCPHDNR